MSSASEAQERLQSLSGEIRARLQPPGDLLARRSHVYRRTVDGAPVVVKEPKRRRSTPAFRREAAFYALAGWRTELSSLAPTCVDVDSERGVLKLAASEGSRDAAQFLRSASSPEALAALSSLGEVVAVLHAISVRDLPAVDRLSLPVAHMLHPSADRLGDITRAQLDYLHLAQGSEHIASNVTMLGASWASTCLIHGDLRLTNVLCSEEGSTSLIDWETWGLGDPCWDLAAVLADRLWESVADASNAGTVDPEDRLREGVAARSAGNRAFWMSYLASRGSSVDAEACWVNLGRHVSIRLVQLGYESLSTEDRLQRDSVHVLQLAENFARAPGNHCLAYLEISRPLGPVGAVT